MPRNVKESVVSRKKVDEGLKTLVNEIVRRHSPQKVYLFGSYARGDYNEASDVDIAVIGDFKERFIDRIGKIMDLNDTDLDIEPLVYTPEEFSRMEERGNPFIENIKKGKLLYSS